MECSGNGEGRGGGRGVAKEGAVPTEADQVVGEGGTCANMLKVLVSKGEVAIGVDMEMEMPIPTPPWEQQHVSFLKIQGL